MGGVFAVIKEDNLNEYKNIGGVREGVVEKEKSLKI